MSSHAAPAPAATRARGRRAASAVLTAAGSRRRALVSELGRGPRGVHRLVTLPEISPSPASPQRRALRVTELRVAGGIGPGTAHFLNRSEAARSAGDTVRRARRPGRSGTAPRRGRA